MASKRSNDGGHRSPRPTVYRGIEMRSRLEALVAGYLDEHGFKWDYEPVCFAGRMGQYLPDFRIQQSGQPNVFVEVKPKPRNLTELMREQVPRMSVIWESEPGARLIIALCTGYPTPHILPVTGDPASQVFRWNLDDLEEAIRGEWWTEDPATASDGG